MSCYIFSIYLKDKSQAIICLMTDFVDIKIVSSASEFSDAMKVREKVFVDELKIDPLLEFDGNDFTSTHILACANDLPVGTLRIRYFNGFVKFERAAVLPEFRKTNVSALMVDAATRFCAAKGYDVMHSVCKKELLHRWAKDGAKPIENAEEIIQNGQTLVPIEQKLPFVPKKINIRTSIDILNKKEGTWFENQPIGGRFELIKKEKTSDIQKLQQKVQDIKEKDNEPQKQAPGLGLIKKAKDPHSR